jgi:HlyD family secretion protein
MRKKAIGAAAIVIVVACVGAWLGIRPEKVDVVRPTRGPLVETLVASGRVEPAARVALAFESLGTVVSVPVSDGATVARGELLVQLDDASARAAVEQARAQLAQAEANVARLRGLGSRVAATEVRTAEIALEAARTREQRERQLESSGATTAVAIEDAARTRQSAEAALARVTEQSRGLGRNGDDVRVALAAREFAQAGLRSAQANLDRMALRAPFDGVVLSHDVEPGQVVQPGATLIVLASSGPSELVVNADESHLARLSLGQHADVSAESYPDQRFDAQVASIAPSVDPLRGTVEVKLRIVEAPPYLRPDMTVSVEIETGRAARALILPNDVVHDLASDRPWVWVVRGGLVERRAIRLGLRGDARVAVVSGIDAGADIVRAERDALTEGQKVRTRRSR